MSLLYTPLWAWRATCAPRPATATRACANALRLTRARAAGGPSRQRLHAFMLRVPPHPFSCSPHPVPEAGLVLPVRLRDGPPRAPGALRARARPALPLRRPACARVGVHDAPGRRLIGHRPARPRPPPYKVDTSRPSLRTNWTRLVQRDLPAAPARAPATAPQLHNPGHRAALRAQTTRPRRRSSPARAATSRGRRRRRRAYDPLTAGLRGGARAATTPARLGGCTPPPLPPVQSGHVSSISPY